MGLIFALAAMAIASACGGSNNSSNFPDAGQGQGDDGTTSDSSGDTGFGGGDDGNGGFGQTDGSTSGGGGVIASALAFVPTQQTLVLTGTSPQSATFQLQATVGGNKEFVTATSLEFNRPDLATVKNGSTITLTTTGSYGGTGQLQGIYGGQSATAVLNIVVAEKNLGTVSTTIGTTLDNASGGSGPDAGTPAPSDTLVTSLLYPYDKTVFPLGLTSPLIMWNAPTGGTHANDVYRFQLTEKAFTYDMYVVPTTPGQLRVPQAVWASLTASNGGPTDPLQVMLSRYDAATMTAAVSVVNSWTIAPASLEGAIYYWTASQANGAAARVGYITRLPAGNGAMPQQLNQGKCMGCHAVSADGTTLVTCIDDPTAPTMAPYQLTWQDSRAWSSFNVSEAAAPQIYLSQQYGADLAITPDGKYTVWGASNNTLPGTKVLGLSNTQTGAIVTTSGLDALQPLVTGEQLEMPAFSPDGTKLAVIVDESTWSAGDAVLPQDPASISYIPYDSATQTFTASVNTIVKSTDPALLKQGLAYPSFTPDGKYVAFHAGTYATGCQNGCVDTSPDDGDLYIAAVAGGGAIRLVNADDPPSPTDLHSSVEPTFDPTAAGGYSWMVFTSMRTWGNQAWPAEVLPPACTTCTGLVNGKRRLWVAAVDQTIGTVDPSHPPFYLEGQDDTPNMRGFWANAACIATPGSATDGGVSTGDAGSGACTYDYECCSGFCQGGMCVNVSKIACQEVGSTCMTAGDCCNSSSNAVLCVGGKCTVSSAQ